jgi:hypothetical protein
MHDIMAIVIAVIRLLRKSFVLCVRKAVCNCTKRLKRRIPDTAWHSARGLYDVSLAYHSHPLPFHAPVVRCMDFSRPWVCPRNDVAGH